MKLVYVFFLITSLLLLSSCGDEQIESTGSGDNIIEVPLGADLSNNQSEETQSGANTSAELTQEQDLDSDSDEATVGENTSNPESVQQQVSVSGSGETNVDIEEYKDVITDQEIKLEESFNDMFGSFDDE